MTKKSYKNRNACLSTHLEKKKEIISAHLEILIQQDEDDRKSCIEMQTNIFKFYLYIFLIVVIISPKNETKPR